MCATKISTQFSIRVSFVIEIYSLSNCWSLLRALSPKSKLTSFCSYVNIPWVAIDRPEKSRLIRFISRLAVKSIRLKDVAWIWGIHQNERRRGIKRNEPFKIENVHSLKSSILNERQCCQGTLSFPCPMIWAIDFESICFPFNVRHTNKRSCLHHHAHPFIEQPKIYCSAVLRF